MENKPVATARGSVTSNPRRRPKRLSLVGFFPGETVTRTAEMSVRCSGFINRPAKIESFDDLSRRQRKVSAHQIRKLSFANPAAASGVDSNRDRFSDADRVGELDFALLSQSSRDNVLGDVTRHVRRRPIDFRRILAGEGAAAMRSIATVCVDDDLAPSQSRVALGAASYKASSRINVILGLIVEQVAGHRVSDNVFANL